MMIRLSTFTTRMWLILVHDLLATAAAVVATFFIRFEEAGLVERWRFLAIFAAWLPRLCGLHLCILRPLQGQVALYLAAPPLQHRARRNRAGGDIVGARLRARGPERLRHVLLRQDYDCPLLVAADRISLRTAHRLSLFPLYPHASACQGRRFDADARPRPHC